MLRYRLSVSACLFLGSVGWLMAACSSPVSPSVPVISLVPVSASASFDFPKQTLVIRDEPTWQTTWKALHDRVSPLPAAPAVDFTRNLVVVVSMGGQPTAGYSVAVTTAEEGTGGISVGVTETVPGANCVVPDIVTNPYAAVSIPFRHPDEPVTFTVTRAVHNCA